MPRVDYDQIAHLYDEPIRDHIVDARLLAFLDTRPDLTPDQVRVLDVGCGTGKQLAVNRGRLPATLMVGVDRFRGMLRIARRREASVGWVNGDGGRLPLVDTSVDYVTNQFSYQHIADREGFVSEVFRVLRPGGRFVMTNIDPWSMSGWSIYRFFPEARDRDYADFLPAETFAALMRAVGFVDVAIERRRRSQPEDLREFLAYASARHRTSQQMVISDEAYAAGLNRIQRVIGAERDGESVSVPSETCLVTIVGDK